MSTLTPMLRQYLEIKEMHKDAILFFRMGDFYEMFFEDAVKASDELSITLTSRDKDKKDSVPMCGVPYHSASTYVSKLIKNGYKVAICDQVGEVGQGLVERKVVRVITPGLLMETDLLRDGENNFLVSLSIGPDVYGLAILDISTGELRVAEGDGIKELSGELSRIGPREILINEADKDDENLKQILHSLNGVYVNYISEAEFDEESAEKSIKSQYNINDLEEIRLAGLHHGKSAIGAILKYLKVTLIRPPAHLLPPERYHGGRYMVMDQTTIRNLEILSNIRDGSMRGTLIGLLNRTVTPMGSRLLKNWILYPMREVDMIDRRLSAVGELVEQRVLRDELKAHLLQIRDLERLTARISVGMANARDMVALGQSLSAIPALRKCLESVKSPILTELRERLDPLDDVKELISRSLKDEPPQTLKDGGLIRDGYNEDLDSLRKVSSHSKEMLMKVESEERRRTGISSLKVRYNRVFGYYIEVTKANLHLIPPDYKRKQTLSGSERFITKLLEEYESRILGAEEKIREIEYRLFCEIRETVAKERSRIQETAGAIAGIDVILSLAKVAQENRFYRPRVVEGEVIHLIEGRHPTVERELKGEPFVPNDIYLNRDSDRLLMITGPNMAGKSTIIRQVAICVILAQMGSYVPARESTIGVVDRIFTRVGASDDLSRGMSTFMVEMSEAANILKFSTKESLILIDEIGRGTSTFDGLAIAWAMAEYILDKIQAMTLFTTHYHELTELAISKKGVKNYNVAVKEWNDRVIFLRKLISGGASRSYGIQVARLAGLPSSLVIRAKEILKNLEEGEFDNEGQPKISAGVEIDQDRGQLSLFGDVNNVIKDKLKELDLNNITPIEAINKLDELKKML